MYKKIRGHGLEHKNLVSRQFGAAAGSYLNSPVHSQGADLLRLTDLALSLNHPKTLDLGCGAGHASFALAKGGARVTSCDLSAEMLAVVAGEAHRRGLPDLQTRQGCAEQLPFADATFDVVLSRFSAHHWTDVPAALLEARRVLKTGGALVVIDVVAPESPLFDTLLQTVEILRDASHVRDYRVAEWGAMMQRAGFQSPESDTWSLQMEFSSWTERMRTSELRVQAIRDVFVHAAEEAKHYFRVQPDGSFCLDVAWMQAQPS
ncbi:MAG: class I SAM-dependent methyltransferase [Thiobacillaceae bacterium]|jgi:ubiquinone/menaquinone biosynthesis C-methylase UbiE